MLDAGPHVFNHNMETVSPAIRRVRPQANYQQSLDVLRFAKPVASRCADQVGPDGRPGGNRTRGQQLLRDLAANQ